MMRREGADNILFRILPDGEHTVAGWDFCDGSDGTIIIERMLSAVSHPLGLDKEIACCDLEGPEAIACLWGPVSPRIAGFQQ